MLGPVRVTLLAGIMIPLIFAVSNLSMVDVVEITIASSHVSSVSWGAEHPQQQKFLIHNLLPGVSVL